MTTTAPGDPRLFAPAHVTVIEPPKGWRMLDWREVWAYRELLWVLSARDVKVRYKQTVLGAGWALLRPLASMLIFTIVFGKLARMPSEGYPYAVFVYTGLLPWLFFSSVFTAAGNSLLGSANLVSKVYFPRLILPVAAAGSSVLDLLISAMLLLVLMAWYGITPTWALAFAPLAFAGLLMASLGCGILLAAVTVRWRDVTHVTPFLVQIWMYISPVVFPVSLVPVQWQWAMYLNPVTGIVEAFRGVFLGSPVNGPGLGISMLVSLALLAAAVVCFERVERRLADII